MEARSLFVVVVLIIAAVIKYAARNAKSWVTPSGTTLEEQLKKRDERMAAAQDAPYRPTPPRGAPQRNIQPRRPMPPPDVPDAACVVCDNTGEDHFAHDKAQRIAQLDDFLKNGIIDKVEYRLLRERYERGL